MRTVYAKALEKNNGYAIIYEDENTSAYVIFIQQEPNIPYRVLNKEGKTDYQASGNLHAKYYKNELDYADIERQNNINRNDPENIRSGISKIFKLFDKIIR